jgi:hypothetical protein
VNSTSKLLVALASALSACRAAPPPAEPPKVVSIAPASAESQHEPGDAPASRCPILPLQLMIQSESDAVPLMTLDASGVLTIDAFGADPLRAKLDPRGCLVGPDGLWAELTPGNTLWTTHSTFEVDGASIRLPESTMSIRPDGDVESVMKDGSQPAGTLRLEGYRADARCAGVLLLGAFLETMPSMAVSDGHPAVAATPSDSRCNAYPRPGAK